MDRYHAGMNLTDPGRVPWASDASVPLWFDLANQAGPTSGAPPLPASASEG